MSEQLDLFGLEAITPARPTLPAPITVTRITAPTATPAAPTPPPQVPTHGAGARATMTRRPAAEVAERAAAAWHSCRVGDGIAIPLGVVAALTLLRQVGRDGTPVADLILAMDRSALVEFHRTIWERTWLAHPYLVEVARPIHDWLQHDPSPKVADAVYTVTRAAIRNGLLHITGDPDPAQRSHADLLGLLLTCLRSAGARGALSEFHTPPEVATLIARMLITPGSLQPGQWLGEPAAGTGGMVRAAAQVMREHGMNPHQFGWWMGEIDPLAAACAAVNAIVWDLGPNVLVYVGDTLAEPDGPQRAHAHRQAVLEHYSRLMEVAALAAAVRQVEALLDRMEGDRSA